MIKYIGLYILIQLLSYSTLAISFVGMIANNWLHYLKTGKAIDFGDYFDLVINNMKNDIENNKDKINKNIFIPCKGAINIYKILHNSMKETLNSDEFLKQSHIMSEMEKMKVESVKKNNKFHILNCLKEMEEAIINPIDYDVYVRKVDSIKRYYTIARDFSYDEVEYICFVTKMKPTYGQMSGVNFVILDAIDLEEIRELFPHFQPIEVDENNPQTAINIISLHKPDEVNTCYAITSIITNRLASKEIIDVEIKPIEEDVVKLTK